MEKASQDMEAGMAPSLEGLSSAGSWQELSKQDNNDNAFEI